MNSETNKQEQWRREFEVFYPEIDDHPNFKREPNGSYVSFYTNDAWEAYLAACEKRTEEHEKQMLRETLRAFNEGESLGCKNAQEEARLKNAKALEAFKEIVYVLDKKDFAREIKAIKAALEG